MEVRKKRTYVRRGPSQDHTQEKQGLDSIPADSVSENIEPLALAGEKEKAEPGQDKTNFESPKKEVLEKNESEAKEERWSKARPMRRFWSPEQKDPIAKAKTDDDSRSLGRKNKKIKHDIDEDEKQKEISPRK